MTDLNPPHDPGSQDTAAVDAASAASRKASPVPGVTGVSERPSITGLPSDGVGLSWDCLRHSAELSLSVELRCLLQAVNTLAVRHRDLDKTPRERSFGELCFQNLLISPEGSAWFAEASQRVAQPVRYAPPECLAGGQPDQQADIFSLGAMLLELLAGRELGDTEAIGISDIPPAENPRWSRFASDELFIVARRATEADPSKRWAGVGDFVEALVIAAEGRLAPRARLAGVVQAVLHGHLAGVEPTVPRPSSRHEPRLRHPPTSSPPSMSQQVAPSQWWHAARAYGIVLIALTLLLAGSLFWLMR